MALGKEAAKQDDAVGELLLEKVHKHHAGTRNPVAFSVPATSCWWRFGLPGRDTDGVKIQHHHPTSHTNTKLDRSVSSLRPQLLLDFQTKMIFLTLPARMNFIRSFARRSGGTGGEVRLRCEG
ncbi:Dsim\GD15217-PA-like protein [Anopheles sinensis]|uniref:Dsim\GD15217-PA-like protein n=1 Tax=Anopheles sinensis TaxID=74873 RepID=A0A084VNQ2_ANOSI|nr:Dsim\GD15217-PA-like protein [Anopheles sinensis]